MWQFGTKPSPSITAYIGEQLRERWRRQETERLETQRVLLARMRGPDLPKPRLRMQNGAWTCASTRPIWCGFTAAPGGTAADAYEGWRKHCYYMSRVRNDSKANF